MNWKSIRRLSLFLLLAACLPQTILANENRSLEKYNGCWWAYTQPFGNESFKQLIVFDGQSNLYATCLPERKHFIRYYNFTPEIRFPGTKREYLSLSYGKITARTITLQPNGVASIGGPSRIAKWEESSATICKDAEYGTLKDLSQDFSLIWGKWHGELDGEEVLIELDEQNKTIVYPPNIDKETPHKPLPIRSITVSPPFDSAYADNYRHVAVVPLDDFVSPGFGERKRGLLPLFLLLPSDASDPLLWESIYPGEPTSQRVTLTKISE